ncbi:hypothetical protein ACQ4LF_25630, partial [Aeromonas salmonicida]
WWAGSCVKETGLGPFPNVYPYDDVVYHTCDTVFMLELAHKPAVTAADDVAACEWRKLREIYPCLLYT